MIAFSLVLIYIVGTTLAGKIIDKKKDSSIQHFFVAKKGLGIWLTVALMFGEMVAGSSTVGNASSAFKMGLSSVWTNWGMVLGTLVFVFCTAKFYRRAGHCGVMSVPEAFAFRFDQRVRKVVLVIILFVYGIIFSQQPVAAAALLSSMLGVNKVIITWIMGLLFGYMALQGLRGLAGMNVVHAMVMFFGMFLVGGLSVWKAGGLGVMMASTPAHYFTVTYPDTATVVAQALGSAFSMILSSTVVNCCLGAKSLDVAKKGIGISALLVVPFALMPALIGIAGFVTMPDAQASNIIYTMAESIHPVFSGIVSMAVLAAIMSTGPGLLLSLSATLTRDFYLQMKPDADEKEQVRFSKAAIIVLAVIATGFGLTTSSILSQILGAFQIRSVAGVVLIIALVWKRVSNRAAFWSILTGGILAGVWHFSGNPFGVQPFWVAVPVSVVILAVLTMMEKDKVSKDYLAYYEKIKGISDNEI
jgi:SSS family solute:Na+ symporter